MIKLLIVDDEKIIRDTISRQINWEELGVVLIGTAANGLEALNIIMDESPEIVMTDIRMPGLSGLELIQRICALNKETEFIILSGYSEFDYAKEAMRYGVRHYLLKPCNEKQIIQSITEVKNNILSARKFLTKSLEQGFVFNIISDSITNTEKDYDSIYKTYSSFMDFDSASYHLHYIYYLEYEFLMNALADISCFFEERWPEIPCFYIYVKNTLLFFYPSKNVAADKIDAFLKALSFPLASVSCRCKSQEIQSLCRLFNTILPKIKRYDTIYIKMYNSLISLSNNASVIKEVEYLVSTLLKKPDSIEESLRILSNIFSSIHDISFIQQLGNIIISKIMSFRNIHSFIESETFFASLYNCESPDKASHLLLEQIKMFFSASLVNTRGRDGELSGRIKEYVSNHLSDPNLSLKWISEQLLFMNPDYVSKKFIKETNEKFSHYLTKKRIEAAQYLFTLQSELNVQEIAQQVGCGNNPLYFSQLFKKYTGMTPSSYYKSLFPLK